MIHTLPPWTTKYRMATIFGQIDSGELAARLGSICNFDRRGNVIWMDDFEQTTLQWNPDGDGDNNSAVLNNTTAKTGTQSCQLNAGEGAGGQAWIYKRLNLPVSGKLGAEVAFTNDPDTGSISLDFRWLTGTHYYSAYLIYYNADKKFQYAKSTGALTDIPLDISLVESAMLWNTMKVVIDTDKLEYVRFLVNDQTVNMSGRGLHKVEETIPTSIYIGVNHASAHASVRKIYVDSVIVTQNEP